MKKFSIIIPVFDEANNIEELVLEISDNLKKYKDYELIIIDDGSNDNTLNVIKKIKNKYNIQLIENKKNFGQSYSVFTGINNSKYNTIVTIDGDGQNNPKDIPRLLECFFSSINIAMVGGIRLKRRDSLIKVLSSKIANNIRLLILKDNCIDTGCSLKVFDKNIFLKFPYFNGIHRFLPAFFVNFGYKTLYMSVDHRPRIAGVSKYGTIDRLFKGIVDLIRVKIIINRYKNKND